MQTSLLRLSDTEHNKRSSFAVRSVFFKLLGRTKYFFTWFIFRNKVLAVQEKLYFKDSP